MIRTGRRNLLTDVEGLTVGNAEDGIAGTGTTVVLTDRPMVAAADVRGGAPGTRDIAALGLTSVVETVDAVVLSGGSAFGLDAAHGAMEWLAEQGRGYPVGAARVPIVPAAILFDLNNRDPAGPLPNYRMLARRACHDADGVFRLGSVGAGTGAVAGDLKGGLGSASVTTDGGLVVAALVAVNSFGSVTIGAGPTFWAWALERDREMGGQRPPADGAPANPLAASKLTALPGANTTIGVVATNAVLTRPEAQRVAIMAHDGLARAIRPCHTPYDGDTVFVLAAGRFDGGSDRARLVTEIGALAGDCAARAIARGIFEATSLGNTASYRDRYLPKIGHWPDGDE